MNPPAPCPVTLPARSPHAHHTAVRSTRRAGVPPSSVSNADPQHAPRAVIPRILPRTMFGAMRDRLRTALILRLPAAVLVSNPALPVSARLCASGPQSSSRAASVRALPRAQHSALAALALAATAANAAPTARVASGCPSGQRSRYVTHPAGRVLRAVRCCAHPFAGVALRARSPRPASLRSHRTAFDSG